MIHNQSENLVNISPEIIQLIQDRKNIPLKESNTAYICEKHSAYEIRGTSFITPIISTLITIDRIREKVPNDPEITRLTKQIKDSIFYPYSLKGNIAVNLASRQANRKITMILNALDKKYFQFLARENKLYDENMQLDYPQIRFNNLHFEDYLKAQARQSEYEENQKRNDN